MQKRTWIADSLIGKLIEKYWLELMRFDQVEVETASKGRPRILLNPFLLKRISWWGSYGRLEVFFGLGVVALTLADGTGEHESYLYDESDGLFSKSDRVGIIAALIDATILGIGLVLVLLWQGGTSSNSTATPVRYSTGNGSQQVTAIPAVAATPSGTAKVRVCEALVISHSPSGKSSRVEFRGNCASIGALASNPNLTVTMLQTRSYSYKLTGG